MKFQKGSQEGDKVICPFSSSRSRAHHHLADRRRRHSHTGGLFVGEIKQQLVLPAKKMH